ncbi:MAG: flagellar biosynthetic protein FliO [Gracilimonas sp.]|uniref:flagellar biosynthetic protein FliO n=1 Tax=Gracilimonas TaxID=649462 RepID=UPI001B17B167|nr:flagellar biosynthetic protein FliO [Gracilimonas sp.]MBO6586844.1 flagellar biosynthetic protein FliO [Gracilimonas sp.]MBO6614668.1 flagellar biosynthetic protein FliO [Gracilimonas sp.]
MDFTKILSQSKKKPQNVLKIVLAFAVALLVIWMFLVSRMEFSATETAASNPEAIERTQGLKTSLGQKTAEVEVSAAEPENAGEDTVFQNAFTTFLVMMGMLGLVWFWARKKSGSTQQKQDGRDLGEHILGQGAQLKFVEINNEVWVMGMTAGSLNLLHRIPKSEWNENEGLEEIAEIKNGSADFKSLYKMFKN